MKKTFIEWIKHYDPVREIVLLEYMYCRGGCGKAVLARSVKGMCIDCYGQYVIRERPVIRFKKSI
jgi:hypothetical protein